MIVHKTAESVATDLSCTVVCIFGTSVMILSGNVVQIPQLTFLKSETAILINWSH